MSSQLSPAHPPDTISSALKRARWESTRAISYEDYVHLKDAIDTLRATFNQVVQSNQGFGRDVQALQNRHNELALGAESHRSQASKTENDLRFGIIEVRTEQTSQHNALKRMRADADAGTTTVNNRLKLLESDTTELRQQVHFISQPVQSIEGPGFPLQEQHPSHVGPASPLITEEAQDTQNEMRSLDSISTRSGNPGARTGVERSQSGPHEHPRRSGSSNDPELVRANKEKNVGKPLEPEPPESQATRDAQQESTSTNNVHDSPSACPVKLKFPGTSAEQAAPSKSSELSDAPPSPAPIPYELARESAALEAVPAPQSNKAKKRASGASRHRKRAASKAKKKGTTPAPRADAAAPMATRAAIQPRRSARSRKSMSYRESDLARL